MSTNIGSRALALVLSAALALPACGAGGFVWVHDLPDGGPRAAPDAWVIGTGDVVNIRVYNQDAISTRGRVGPDGTLAVPLVGEVAARGLRPVALARQIEARLRPFIVAPSVSVTLDEIQPARVSVLGEVAHPGVFVIPPGAGVLHALALAGGLTEFAGKDRVFVLRARPDRAMVRVRFTYEDLTRGVGRSAAFTLEPGDTVIVE